MPVFVFISTRWHQGATPHVLENLLVLQSFAPNFTNEAQDKPAL